MVAVARGIDETSNAVQFSGFFGKHFILKFVFRKYNFTCVFICFFLCQSTFFIYFSKLNIIQGFSLNFARTLGRAVDKLLNGSRINSRGQFIFGFLKQHGFATKPYRRCIFSHFRDMVKTGLLFTFFFRKSELPRL